MELILWGLFFGLFLCSLLLDIEALENILLVIGVIVGLISLYFMATLARNYKKNKKEINAWGYRFIFFKILPVILSLLVD